MLGLIAEAEVMLTLPAVRTTKAEAERAKELHLKKEGFEARKPESHLQGKKNAPDQKSSMNF